MTDGKDKTDGRVYVAEVFDSMADMLAEKTDGWFMRGSYRTPAAVLTASVIVSHHISRLIQAVDELAHAVRGLDKPSEREKELERRLKSYLDRKGERP
jgi:hypothetical protein